jgi:hypothetical protein
MQQNKKKGLFQNSLEQPSLLNYFENIKIKMLLHNQQDFCQKQELAVSLIHQ